MYDKQLTVYTVQTKGPISLVLKLKVIKKIEQEVKERKKTKYETDNP